MPEISKESLSPSETINTELTPGEYRSKLGLLAITSESVLKRLLPLAVDICKAGPTHPLRSEEIWSGTVGGGRGDRMGSKIIARLGKGHFFSIEHDTQRFNSNIGCNEAYELIIARQVEDDGSKETGQLKARHRNNWGDQRSVSFSGLTMELNGSLLVPASYLALMQEDLDVMKGFGS